MTAVGQWTCHHWEKLALMEKPNEHPPQQIPIFQRLNLYHFNDTVVILFLVFLWNQASADKIQIILNHIASDAWVWGVPWSKVKVLPAHIQEQIKATTLAYAKHGFHRVNL